WLKFFGGSGFGYVPQALANCFTPASWPVFQDELLALAEGQTRWESVLPIRDLYGNERIVVWRLAVQPGHRETLCRVLISFTDITDRKRAEEALREASQFNEQVIRNVQEGIVVYDRNLRYQLWNPFMERLTGYTAQELLGRRPEEVFPFLRETGVLERLERALAGETPGQLEFPYTAPRLASSGWTSDTSGPLRNAVGEIIGVIGMVRDITDRKLAEEGLHNLHLQLAHLGRLSILGELLAGIAHEINQPLYAIVNYVNACRNLLTQDQPNLVELREWNQEIAAAAARAGAIIQRLRGFLKRSDVQRLPVPIDEVIQDSLDLVAFETRRLQIVVQYVPDAANCPVSIDRVQIQQVLVNLLGNACEALEGREPGTRTLTVGTVREGSFVEISVADNGAGLPSPGLGKIFEPFVTTKPRGLGMGLAISKTIVEDHGGHIRATANPRGGATFRFTLPAAAEDLWNV
ncbi:MAG: PAS domain S-box protein, partial [Planctomycetota bacterium]|nr:PAS domain S-box protein [Planctomycetota bacterium]